MAPLCNLDVRHKQIARAVKGQDSWILKSGGKGGSHSVRSKFIDLAGALDGEAVESRRRSYKQIARAVKGQISWVQSIRRQRWFALQPE